MALGSKLKKTYNKKFGINAEDIIPVEECHLGNVVQLGLHRGVFEKIEVTLDNGDSIIYERI